MIERPFGDTGFVVSALGLGAGGIGDEGMSDDDASNLLSAALDLGITFLDSARSYGSSEARIGRWLAEDPSRRDRVVLSTKCGYGIDGTADWTAECITRGVDEALRRMRTDVIDVMHLHSCPRDVLERGDVIEPLDRARDAGKIKVAAYSGENDALEWAIGGADRSPEESKPIASGRFGAVQCSVNLFDQPSSSLLSERVAVVAKRALGNAPWRFFHDRPVGHYAEAYWERMHSLQIDPTDWNLTWPDLALRFAAFSPGVSTALVGTKSREHLEANARIIERGPLPSSIDDRIRATFRARARDARWVGLV